MDIAELKSWWSERRDEAPKAIRIRLHRAISWAERAEAFIFADK